MSEDEGLMSQFRDDIGVTLHLELMEADVCLPKETEGALHTTSANVFGLLT